MPLLINYLREKARALIDSSGSGRPAIAALAKSLQRWLLSGDV